MQFSFAALPKSAIGGKITYVPVFWKRPVKPIHHIQEKAYPIISVGFAYKF